MTPYDLLEDYERGPETPERGRRTKRPSKRALRNAQRAAERDAKRRRLAELHRNPPPGRALLVVFGVGLLVIVGAWWLPQLTAGLAPRPTTPVATPSRAPTNPAPTITPTAGAQNAATVWARAYFRGTDWQSLTAPESVATLSQQRAYVYFGADSALPAEGVRVEEVQFRDGDPAKAVDGATWSTTLDVLFDLPDRTAGTLTLTLVYHGDAWLITALEPEFVGAV